MENKTSTIVIINVIIFLLYLKFGTMAIWVPAAAGFCLIVLFIFIVLILQLFFVEFYSTKFLPTIKRITGTELILTTMSVEQRTALKKGFLPLLILLVVIFWGISRLLMLLQ